MWEYIIPITIMAFILAVFFILLRAVLIIPSEAKVEIIINDDDKEETEKTLISARLVADRYFKNAQIYIREENGSIYRDIYDAFDK